MTLNVEGPPQSLSLVPAPASSDGLKSPISESIATAILHHMGPRIRIVSMPAESSLRPLEVSAHHASLAAAARSFELRRVQRIGGPARRHRKARSTSRGHVTRTTLLRHPCRRSQADMTVDRRETNTPLSSFAGSGLPPLFWIYAQPLNVRSSDHGRGAILVDVARFKYIIFYSQFLTSKLRSVPCSRYQALAASFFLGSPRSLTRSWD